jgi:hypothetical protein
MSVKSKIVSLAVLAACFAGANSVQAAASLKLNVVYIGSTTTNGTNASRTPSGQIMNSLAVNSASPFGNLGSITGLTSRDLAASDTQSTSGLKNYFGVYAIFTPDQAGDVVGGTVFDVSLTGGWSFTSSLATTLATTQKWLPYNPNDLTAGSGTFGSPIGDGGTAGDMLAILANQTDWANVASITNVGTSGAGTIGFVSSLGSPLGVFATTFGGPLAADAKITITPTAGKALNYFDANGGLHEITAASGAITGYTFTVQGGAPATPEPASLGVLALGGLALLARRRK